MKIEVSVTTLVAVLLVVIVRFGKATQERIEITDIQATGEPSYMTANTTVHSNRTKFDISFTIHRELNKHDLVMNMKLKMKADDKSTYRILYNKKRIDLCKFLTNYDEDKLLKLFFKNALHASTMIRCPIKTGTYHMKNFGTEANFKAINFPRGKYRMNLEIASPSETEVVKLFSMQINSVFKKD